MAVPTDNYILDENGEPKAVDALTWAKNFETADRNVAKDTIGKFLVSTVFLGLDHNWSGEGLPVLWETMVFGLPDDEEMMLRYTSKADALQGHKRTCDEIRSRGWIGGDDNGTQR